MTVIGVSPGRIDTGGSFGSGTGGASDAGTPPGCSLSGTVASVRWGVVVGGAFGGGATATTAGAVVVGAGSAVVEVVGCASRTVVVVSWRTVVAVASTVDVWTRAPDAGACVVYAAAVKAAIPAARPATGKITFRRSSSACSVRAT